MVDLDRDLSEGCENTISRDSRRETVRDIPREGGYTRLLLVWCAAVRRFHVEECEKSCTIGYFGYDTFFGHSMVGCSFIRPHTTHTIIVHSAA